MRNIADCELECEQTCLETQNGWLWYCGEHETHGNADSEHEAEAMAGAHMGFFEERDETCCIHLLRREAYATIKTAFGH